jgi:hypothetical protein
MSACFANLASWHKEDPGALRPREWRLCNRPCFHLLDSRTSCRLQHLGFPFSRERQDCAALQLQQRGHVTEDGPLVAAGVRRARPPHQGDSQSETESGS